MIATDISTFMNWWVLQISYLINQTIGKIYTISWGGVSLATFILAITILNVFLGIILNSTRHTGNKIESKIERKKK